MTKSSLVTKNYSCHNKIRQQKVQSKQPPSTFTSFTFTCHNLPVHDGGGMLQQAVVSWKLSANCWRHKNQKPYQQTLFDWLKWHAMCRYKYSVEESRVLPRNVRFATTTYNHHHCGITRNLKPIHIYMYICSHVSGVATSGT